MAGFTKELALKVEDPAVDKALRQIREAIEAPKGVVTGDCYITFTGGTTATQDVEQPGLPSGAVIQAFLMRDQTPTRTYAQHVSDDVRFVCGSISSAGFKIYATAAGATTGKYRVRWVWHRGN